MSYASAIMSYRSAIANAGSQLSHGALCLTLALTTPALGQAARARSGAVPVYSIAQPDWPLWRLPSRHAAHRGALAPKAGVPLFATAEGPGCKNLWWQVGAHAWLCPDDATITEADTASLTSTVSAHDEVLTYVAVGKNGALGYRLRQDIDVGSPNAEFQAGFLLAITQASDWGDSTALLTTHDYWLSARDVQTVKPSAFTGTAVDGELDVAWVSEKRTFVYSAPDMRKQPPVYVERLARVEVSGQQQKGSVLWLRTEQGWLKASDVRMPEVQAPPQGIAADERWLDVDTKTQTLVAYVGSRPVYATIVSTGRGKPGTEQATPVGLHRLWIKLYRSDMDNLEDPETQSPYAVEAVPYVMFFDRGYGIHGTYWHDRFGSPKSHGCVNVSLADARWLFQFTSPHLPIGWSAVFPTAQERGTLVRVR